MFVAGHETGDLNAPHNFVRFYLGRWIKAPRWAGEKTYVEHLPLLNRVKMGEPLQTVRKKCLEKLGGGNSTIFYFHPGSLGK